MRDKYDMKVAEFKKELTSLSVEELEQKLDGLRRDLFNMQLNAATAHLKDYSQFNKLRKNVARVLTVIKQKKHEAQA